MFNEFAKARENTQLFRTRANPIRINFVIVSHEPQSRCSLQYNIVAAICTLYTHNVFRTSFSNVKSSAS